MIKKPLKQSVQQHLNTKTLSARQLNQLQLLQMKHSAPVAIKPFAWLRTASLASVILLSALSLYFIQSQYFTPQSIEQLIAEEVAGNHLKLKPLEVRTDQIQGIKDYFMHLDFLPVTPTFLDSSKQTLLGGRYCSIQGITAAQLRIKNNDTGEVQSLYETQYDKRVFNDLPELEEGEKPLTVYAKGIKVDIWVEKGVLFALTDMQQTVFE